MLRCAAELADVRIPVQACRSFQTRDFLALSMFRLQRQYPITCITPSSTNLHTLLLLDHIPFEIYRAQALPRC